MTNGVDISGLKKKFKQLQVLGGAATALPQDGASFFMSKLVGEILAKSSASAAGTREGNSYVRTLSGNLRRSQVIDKKAGNRYHIHYRHGRSGVDYGLYVDQWAMEKYGQGYYGLTTTLWGKTINTLMQREIKRIVRTIDKGGLPKYRNPFPV